MGFRSTFVTEDVAIKLPEWFKQKWQGFVYFTEAGYLPIASKGEFKTYIEPGASLATDFQRVLNELEKQESWSSQIEFVWLHECGGITKVQVYKDKIVYSEPSKWIQTDCVTHDYCYGCSKPDEQAKN